jgi:hypothetical protein
MTRDEISLPRLLRLLITKTRKAFYLIIALHQQLTRMGASNTCRDFTPFENDCDEKSMVQSAATATATRYGTTSPVAPI